jgi:hypothetical protein
VVEVYPAAALRAWGLPATGYKNRDPRSREASRAVRIELVRTVLELESQ